MTTWFDHQQRWRSCQRCELHALRRNVVLGMGRVPQGDRSGVVFMAIGQYPGKDEDLTGLPMQGNGGQWTHWAITKLLGVQWHDVFFGNILGCKPPEGKNPRVKWVHACAPRVWGLINIVDPQLIISMGLVAAKFFAEDNKITMNAKAGQNGVWRQRKVFYVTHPAEPMRAKSSGAREDSIRRVQHDFAELRNYCIEQDLVERIIE